MASNFLFGLIVISEGNGILVLLDQTYFFLYILLFWASKDTFRM